MNQHYHPGFDREFRAFHSAHPQAAGVVLGEMDWALELKEKGKRHPREESLKGKVAGINKLSLRPEVPGEKHDIRVYYLVAKGEAYFLQLDAAKRRGTMLKSAIKKLHKRRNEILKTVN